MLNAGVPESAREFVLHTMDVVNQNKPHCIAAAFTLGREDCIPQMFRRVIDGMPALVRATCPSLLFYLERHIELDGDKHSILGMKLLESLCHSEQDVTEAKHAAGAALQARANLWHGILRGLQAR